MGTPRECDEFPDAAEDHLIAEGGHFARSPRAFARGRYEGREGIILHLRRRCDEGTFFHVETKLLCTLLWISTANFKLGLLPLFSWFLVVQPMYDPCQKVPK